MTVATSPIDSAKTIRDKESVKAPTQRQLKSNKTHATQISKKMNDQSIIVNLPGASRRAILTATTCTEEQAMSNIKRLASQILAKYVADGTITGPMADEIKMNAVRELEPLGQITPGDVEGHVQTRIINYQKRQLADKQAEINHVRGQLAKAIIVVSDDDE